MIMLNHNCFQWWKLFILFRKQPNNQLIELTQIFPDLFDLNVPHNSPWHIESYGDLPAGNILAHTCLVYLNALKYVEDYKIEGEDKMVLLLAALFHDIGKPAARKSKFDKDTGDWIKDSFPGHELISAKMTETILMERSFPRRIRKRVCHLVKKHMDFHNYSTCKVKDIAKIKKFMNTTDFDLLWKLGDSDTKGTINAPEMKKVEDFPKGFELANLAKYKVKGYGAKLPERIVTGWDLPMPMKPGLNYGRILYKTYNEQLRHPELTKERLINFAIGMYKSMMCENKGIKNVF